MKEHTESRPGPHAWEALGKRQLPFSPCEMECDQCAERRQVLWGVRKGRGVSWGIRKVILERAAFEMGLKE